MALTADSLSAAAVSSSSAPPAPAEADGSAAGAGDGFDSAFAALPSLLYDDIDDADAVSSAHSDSATGQLLSARHAYATRQLHAQLSSVSAQLARTEEQLRDSVQRADKYAAQCAVFARNISVLYDTAVGEVRRKQEEVDRLREWKAAQERRARMTATERQPLGGAGNAYTAAGNGAAAVSGGVLGSEQPSITAKRAHDSMRTHLPMPPFPPPDAARKRARVATG